MINLSKIYRKITQKQVIWPVLVPALTKSSTKHLYFGNIYQIYHKVLIIYQFVTFERKNASQRAYKHPLLLQKVEIHRKSLSSFLAVKTASTRKIASQVKVREKVELFKYQIRFSTAFVVFEIFDLKVVQVFRFVHNVFSPTPGFLARDVTHHKISHRVCISWTPNTLRMPKMYSFMGIWTILEKLLTFKVIATLR